MSDWTVVEGEAALAEGQILAADLEGTAVLLVRHRGCIYAVENRCTHDGSEMNEGFLDESGALVCPHHGARFSLQDGAALSAPAYEPLTTFAVRVEAGCIALRDERW